MKNIRLLFIALALCAIPLLAAENPFVGNWALTLPTGGAGWLGVTETNGQLYASLLWGGGSPFPLYPVSMDGATLVMIRSHIDLKKMGVGRPVPQRKVQTYRATLSGDLMRVTTETKIAGAQKATDQAEFKGQRIPPPSPAPDLSKVKFGDSITLFNGKDLTGWRLTDPQAASGWSVKDGLLVNTIPAKRDKHCGNLRTDQEFEDFNIKVEVRVPEHGNSGVYLRGIYECQVFDSYGKPVDCHNMGAIYGRITPTVSAEKKAGEWQTLDITLVERHATVILNGTKIIDNQPILGCTGGALTSDEFKPGPIYLQGDHTGIEYRSIVLRPVVK